MSRSAARVAIDAFKAGEIVLVVDDADRENEGDFILAAEFATAEKIAFFLQHTSGFICVSTTGERMDELDIPMMVEHNTEVQKTAFGVTVDVKRGTSTGISASDRAATIRAIADRSTKPSDLARPGHVHVLRAEAGGVLKRAGHTEAGVDLALLAGVCPAAVLCEVVTGDKLGMARLPELQALAAEHGLAMVTVGELVRYRLRAEQSAGSEPTVRVSTSRNDSSAPSGAKPESFRHRLNSSYGGF